MLDNTASSLRSLPDVPAAMPQGDLQDPLAQALARCAYGDPEGLRVVFEAEGGRLVAMAQRILRRRDLAEEVVQEAFVQIFAKAGQYTPDRGSARGWIYAIVRNRALNALRDARWEEPANADAIEALREADVAQEALGAWSRLEASSRLRACLETLDEAKRHSVLLAYVSGYTHGEIAGRLRVPLGTAKAWVRRGLASLRECMA